MLIVDAAQGAMALLSILPPSVGRLDDIAAKNLDGQSEIDAMLLEIAKAFRLVPLEHGRMYKRM
jgi:hypothetical protein